MSDLKIRIAVAVLVIVLALVQFLFDPISSIQHSLDIANIRNGFDTAQSMWVSASVEDYSFEIHGRSQSICAVDAQVKVEDNAVKEVRHLTSASSLPPEQWADPDWGNEVFLCDYNHFTVPQMFSMLAKTLQNSPFAVLKAEFDPQYGFITRFEDGLFASSGRLSMRTKSVYNEFQISNFKLEQ